MLDPFVGSGTTSVAALLLGRRSLGFEIAERYLEIAKRRMREARERFLVPGRPADTEPMGPRQGTFL